MMTMQGAGLKHRHTDTVPFFVTKRPSTNRGHIVISSLVSLNAEPELRELLTICFIYGGYRCCDVFLCCSLASLSLSPSLVLYLPSPSFRFLSSPRSPLGSCRARSRSSHSHSLTLSPRSPALPPCRPAALPPCRRLPPSAAVAG